MFDITPDDINQLNDIDLRELVGRLCEAELSKCGLSPAAVTWGGNQTAADGGLDVRVALPPSASINGFIPRPSTGFQVKKPDMPRAEIIAEMRPQPAGTIRPVIQELANEAGAYVIVSSSGSTADGPLQSRQRALREALVGVVNAQQLHTDFYDRTRLATWVRCYPGLIAWVKERVGRALSGWRPYGPWAGAADDDDAEYLLDDKLRIHLGKQHDGPAQSVADAIDEVRDELAQPGKIVRLVGLSGVGKTRLVQALFDARIGLRPLPPSLAVYANLSDDPDPQPGGLASDLIANRRRAVLIVDNCPPELHRRLSELCVGQGSTVSVLTVEYDVRDDQPEGTQVVTLDTSSPELIERLIQRRYQHLSQVDAHTISGASGGNARIAIALAETVERSDTIAGLSSEELFQRLFWQRQAPNEALYRAAQACSLVYSFQGEVFEGNDAELPRLALLAGQPAVEIYRHVGELLRRDLVQQRGVWRAVLPHAVANRLAVRALEDIPYGLISQQLVEGGTQRLARSFARRLSFLHNHPKAITIVKGWLAPGGLLSDVTTLDDNSQAMFESVTPVLPEAALAALERAGQCHADKAPIVWQRYSSLLRSIAYDAQLFDRSARVLALAATQSTDDAEAKRASDTFISLFTILLSGTNATIEQRLSVVEWLLKSGETKARALGLAALDMVLEATHFTSHYQFEFGARSRDYGYRPQTREDETGWYGAAFTLLERLALTEQVLKPELRAILARKFRGLWTSTHMYSDLERLLRSFSTDGFWRDGWVACRQTLQFDADEQTPEATSRLSALATELGPSNLSERVRALVLGDRLGGFDLEDTEADSDPVSSAERFEVAARELGVAVASDDPVFAELLPQLLRGGSRTWSFGCGLASGSTDPRSTWVKLVEGLELIPTEQRDVQVLRGFLTELWKQDKELAQHLLESAHAQPILLAFLPVLQTAVGLDEWGVEQLKRALSSGHVSIQTYRNLALGRATDNVPGDSLKDLLLLITDQPGGFSVALDILYMRLHSDRLTQRQHEPVLLEAGREILKRVTFRRKNQGEDHELAGVVKACLSGSANSPIAAEVASRLREAVTARETDSYDNNDLLKALLEIQPAATLDALFVNGEEEQRQGYRVFERFGRARGNPADAISCEELVAWCGLDSESRYPWAASIITFAHRPNANDPQVWSSQARALLTNAPDPRSVLAALLPRFRPMSWSGSRAALIEMNAQLLNDLDWLLCPELLPYVMEAKAQLAKDVASERRWETDKDRVRDERFE